MSTAETATRDAEEVARSYFAAIERRDLDGMVSEWRPGSTDTMYGMAELRAPDQIRDWFGKLFAAFPDFRFAVVDLVAGGDKAAVRWSASGTFNGSGDFEGMIPNGASIEIEGLDLLTVRDGLIVENFAYTNAMDTARKLGAMPPQASFGERAMLGGFNLKTRLGRLLRRR